MRAMSSCAGVPRIAETRLPETSRCHERIHDFGSLQPVNALSINSWVCQVLRHTRRDRQVNDDLGRLPEMQNDGIRGVGGRHQLRWRVRQALGHAPKVALKRHRPLRQNRAIDRAHDDDSDASVRR